MADKPETKAERKFLCREYLYDVFSAMSGEYDCSVDYLINEAMREYARARQQSGPMQEKPSAAPLTKSDESIATSIKPKSPEMVEVIEAARVSNGALRFIYKEEVIEIDKDEFVIGRSKKGTDFAIRDGAISRKHAAVVKIDGTYYIKDQGSTNGITFNGRRVMSKRIQDGDIFRLSEHEIRFEYG